MRSIPSVKDNDSRPTGEETDTYPAVRNHSDSLVWQYQCFFNLDYYL